MTASILTALLVVALGADAAATGPLGPAESIERFVLPSGLVIELVASEPIVTDPVAVSFDERGRLYVVEYRDYPQGPPAGEPPRSRIRLLEDQDGDGRMDVGHVFADGMTFAQGIMAWKGGLLVTAGPGVHFLADTDGDHRADHRETLFTIDLERANPQLRSAHPRWGPDNWIYLTNGLGAGRVASAGLDAGRVKEAGLNPAQAIDVRRSDFRFDPRTLALEPATGFGQFGNTFDDWGNRFVCSNRNPAIFCVLPYRAMRRNPFASIPASYEDAAPSGGEAKVYPLVETRTTAFSHTGTHTAACGVLVYRGGLLGADYAGNVFVCEPTGHLVTRSLLGPRGVGFRAQRAKEKVEFLASTDPWFRPVSLADGPDGALYVVDMYRQVIEHPDYMVSWFPKEYIASLNFRAGDDRGRIYRIRPADRRPASYDPPRTTQQLVGLLSSPNGWRRDLGQRLLLEQQAKQAVPELRQLVRRGDDPRTRLHALWTLDGLGAVDAELLGTLLRDPNPRLQEHAARLAGSLLPEAPGLMAPLAHLAASPDPRARFQTALSLGETTDLAAVRPLADLAVHDAEDTWIVRAILTASARRSGLILSELVGRPEFRGSATRGRIELLTELAGVVGARGDENEMAGVLALLTESGAGAWWQMAVLGGLAQGLPRHAGALGRTNLARWLADPPAACQPHVARVRRLLDQCARMAQDERSAVPDRVAVIGLLGHRSFDETAQTLTALLAASQPADVQQAAAAAIRTLGDERFAPVLIERWKSLTPAVRSAAIDFLLARPRTTLALLEAMRDGHVSSSILDADRRTRLLRSKDPKIHDLAVHSLGGEVSPDRKEVIERYRPAVAAASDPRAGQQVFRKVCANCHRIAGEGHLVGPDISDVRNKTPEVLLYDILDPNRAVEPRWTDYSVATVDGQVFNGILVQETDTTIVLRRAEGKEEVISRQQIELVQATGKSLMPDGIEKDLGVQEVADLISFLKSQK